MTGDSDCEIAQHFGKLVVENGKGIRKDQKVNIDFRHKPDLPYNIFELKGGIYCRHKWVKVLYRLVSNTEVSENLDNYKKVRSIPKYAQKNPRGSKKAGIATDERIWTAQRVKQAIDALAGGGAGVSNAVYDISWDGVIGVAPSKNVLYDFIESQVFKVDVNSNILPLFWGGTQAEYDAYFNITDFPSGVPNNYFTVITNGVV